MKKLNLTQWVLGTVLTGGLVISPLAFADDTAQLKEQIRVLQDKVNQLESEDPFVQMVQMREAMDRNMGQAMMDSGMSFTPRTDMKQADKEYIITMDIPGMDKDKINVETKQGMLIISGERQSETQDNKNNQYYRQERSFGSFTQAVPLPEDAKADHIEASYKNGVLTVTVAREKKEEKKSGEQKIMVK
jgi:HSP20 family molecular chaperone IbpA